MIFLLIFVIAFVSMILLIEYGPKASEYMHGYWCFNYHVAQIIMILIYIFLLGVMVWAPIQWLLSLPST